MTDFLLAHPFFTLAVLAWADRDAAVLAAVVCAALGLLSWHEALFWAWSAAAVSDLLLFEAGKVGRGASCSEDSAVWAKSLRLQSVFGFERLFAWKLGQNGASRRVFWLRALPLGALRAALLFGAAGFFSAFFRQGGLECLTGRQPLAGLLLLTIVAAVAGRTVVQRLAFRLTETIHHENSAR